MIQLLFAFYHYRNEPELNHGLEILYPMLFAGCQVLGLLVIGGPLSVFVLLKSVVLHCLPLLFVNDNNDNNNNSNNSDNVISRAMFKRTCRTGISLNVQKFNCSCKNWINAVKQSQDSIQNVRLMCEFNWVSGVFSSIHS